MVRRHRATHQRDLRGLKAGTCGQRLAPRVSVSGAELRLHLAYACHERVGRESFLKSLPLEVIELIGQHLTIGVAVHGLIWRSA